MTKRLSVLLLIGVLVMTILLGSNCIPKQVTKPTGIAVEFNSHAACAYIAHAKGWFEEEGLELLPVFQVYESGAAIAAALARGDIQVGYMGLTGAILAYAQGVPIRVIAGVHKYGYGLAARPELTEISSLSNRAVGCLREGTVTDILLNLMIDRYHLTNISVLRMGPSEEVIALIAGRLDAAFVPEQHATVAEFSGFPMLITSQDLWPGMQGDVLVVRTELIDNNPELLKKLTRVTQRATAWINEHPDDAAEIISQQLQIAGEKILLAKEAETNLNLEITPEIISRSMDRIEYTTDIEPGVVQDTIEYMVQLGYIKEGIEASDILYLAYLDSL